MKKWTIFLSIAIILPLLIFGFSRKRKVVEIKEAIDPRPTIITKQGIPDKHELETFFVEQAPEKNWEQPWQDACEEAALLTVDYYYRQIKNPDVRADILKMIDFEGKQGWGHDTDLDQMAIIGRDYLGYQTKILDDPDIDIIKKNLADNVPIIAPANGKILFEENRNFKSGGPWYHNVVILGFDDRREKFVVHDVGTRKGAYFEYSYTLLMKAIHDLPLDRNKENINQGAKRVLLLIK